MNDQTRTAEPAFTLSQRQKKKRIAVLTLTAVLGASASSWLVLRGGADKPPGMTAAPVAAMTVTETAARMSDWSVQFEASGVIAPWQEAIIGTQVSGMRLVELNAAPGDAVRRGQVLARFDSEALGADVAQLRAALRETRALAAETRANRERALKLKDSGSISEQDVLQAVTRAETAEAQVESRQAQLSARELQLRYATVVSPDDGVISTRTATIGMVGTPGNELFRLIRQNRLEWRGELTAAQLRQAAPSQPVVLTLPDGQPAEATLRQLASSLDPQTRLVIVYADVVPGSTARAGMYAQGRIVVAKRPALVVPAGSVVIRDGRSHVFRFDAQSDVPKVQRQAVTVGRRQGREVEIIEGLAVNDRVVVQGAGFLNDGDSVRVAQATTPVSGK